jgi:hypothetical protein
VVAFLEARHRPQVHRKGAIDARTVPELEVAQLLEHAVGIGFDLVSQRITEVLQSFPDLILAMAISMAIGTGMPAVILAIALALPFIFVGNYFSFVALPMNFLLILAVFIVVYLGLVELMKRWFYRRYPAATEMAR